jgi:hypothetical protein
MRLVQLAKKIGNFPKRRLLPLWEIYLFHSELAAGARQTEKRMRLIQPRQTYLEKQINYSYVMKKVRNS